MNVAFDGRVHLGAGLRWSHGDPAARGRAAIACHRANIEDLPYGYSDTGSPAAPSTTWIWTANWAAG